MKVRPLNDRVIIKRVADQETTSGGLIIPEAAKEKQARGKGERPIPNSPRVVSIQVPYKEDKNGESIQHPEERPCYGRSVGSNIQQRRE